MATDSGSPSLLARFLDSFLHERNIKWLLAVGMLILLASSLFLVVSQWDRSAPEWKYVVFLGYSGAAFAVGEWTYRRLGLRRTGTVLRSLTVLLIPILFLALGRLPEGALGLLGGSLFALLAAATIAFSVVAGRQVFRHFLRGTQPTFLACYLALAGTGALGSWVGAAGAVPVGLCAWALFAVGSVKVSRHVFWLTEERRAPRVFGFFPIALLGGQFLTLFLLFTAPHLTLEWFGVGCVLVAVPVLATADRVAGVFQQRTGDLVRPLPWSIVAPFGVGLVLCAAGMALTTKDLFLLQLDRTQPLALASAGTALLMALVARRTGKPVFAWATLVCVLLAYQASPAFFLDAAKAALRSGASAVREPRLPFAFYGLTYLPLLATLTALGARRLGVGEPFGPALRRFAVGLTLLLLALSVTHPKAAFPVGVALLVVFAMQVVLFRERLLVLPAILAGLTAAVGLESFATRVLAFDVSGHFRLHALTAFAAGLLLAGWRLDPWLDRLRTPARDGHLVQRAGLLVTLGVACGWLLHATLDPIGAPWLFAVALFALLLVHSLRWTTPWLGAVSLAFGCASVLLLAESWGLPIGSLVDLATALAVALWVASYALQRRPGSRLARAFAQPSECLSGVALLVGLVFVHLPAFVATIAGTVPGGGEISPPAQLLIAGWCFDAARRYAAWPLAALGCVAALGLAGASFLQMAGPEAWEWLPAVWTGLALAALPVSEGLRRHRLGLQDRAADDLARRRAAALDQPIACALLAVLALAAVGSLLVYALPLRVAGGLGLLGLLALSVLRQQPALRLPALAVVNWQLLSLAAGLLAPGRMFLFDLDSADLAVLVLPVACLAELSAVAWQWFAPRFTGLPGRVVRCHLAALRVLGAALLVCSLGVLPALNAGGVALAVTAFALAALAEGAAACRLQSEERAWVAAAFVAAAMCYLAFFRVFAFGTGLGMFVMLALGGLLWAGKELVERHARLRVLARPLALIGFALPLVAVGIGVWRHFAVRPEWRGANSLALLLAAGFYFWRGLELGRRDLLTLAGVVLNVAVFLLCFEWNWSDPQFFMVPIGVSVLALVQLFRREISPRYLAALRYAGALVILVSPVFHVVEGSWLHLFTLMLASVAVIVVAIGLRVRALVYTGTAFLLADLAAMLVFRSLDDTNVLWMAGLAVGAGVVALAAFCERNREVLSQRARLLTEALKAWE